MEHRGGCGYEPNTGDGAGALAIYTNLLSSYINNENGDLNSHLRHYHKATGIIT
jgi:glutamate synthase domain-containing protein 1